MDEDKFTAKVIAYNRITIPKTLVDFRKIKKGDYVEVVLVGKKSQK